MFNWKLRQNQNRYILTAATICALGITACGSGQTNTVASKQGTIPLDSVKVGVPTTVLQDAMMTFAEDPKGASAGKTQFLSRIYDTEGGQYIANCRNGQVFELSIYHLSAPITKEAAIARMKQLFPADIPTESKVDDSGLKGASLNELHYFGDKYVGELVFTDNSGTKVKMINAWTDQSKTAQTPG